MAPLPELLTDLGREMLDSLPPVLRDDPDTVAVIHCHAKEAERLEETIIATRAEFNPRTAGLTGLTIMARILRLPVDEGGDVEALREAVLRRLQTIEGDPSGRNWVDRLSLRIGTSWSYQEHVPGDATTPDPYVLRFTLPFTPGSAAWVNALRAARDETPSELALEFVSSGGFILDQSQMDVEGMGV